MSRLPADDKTQPFGWMNQKIKFRLEGYFENKGKFKHLILSPNKIRVFVKKINKLLLKLSVGFAMTKFGV